jgi:CheY-like chemotaxis protein
MTEQKAQILLADDEATFRETFAKILAEEGFAVTAVCDGKEALEAIRKRPYALALLDIQMPGSDGISVLREIINVEIRALNKPLQNISERCERGMGQL